MKLYFCLTSILCIFSSIQAQSKVTRVDSIGQYYHHVYAAEKNIIDANYASANAEYKKAFAYLKAPFAVDVVNSTICSVNEGDNNNILLMAKLMVWKGADTTFFQRKYLLTLNNPPNGRFYYRTTVAG